MWGRRDIQKIHDDIKSEVLELDKKNSLSYSEIARKFMITLENSLKRNLYLINFNDFEELCRKYNLSPSLNNHDSLTKYLLGYRFNYLGLLNTRISSGNDYLEEHNRVNIDNIVYKYMDYTRSSSYSYIKNFVEWCEDERILRLNKCDIDKRSLSIEGTDLAKNIYKNSIKEGINFIYLNDCRYDNFLHVTIDGLNKIYIDTFLKSCEYYSKDDINIKFTRHDYLPLDPRDFISLGDPLTECASCPFGIIIFNDLSEEGNYMKNVRNVSNVSDIYKIYTNSFSIR